MREDTLQQLIEAAGDLIRPKLRSSEPLRRFAHALGRWLIEHAAAAATDTEGKTAVTATDPVPPQPQPEPLSAEPSALPAVDSAVSALSAETRPDPAPSTSSSRPPAVLRGPTILPMEQPSAPPDPGLIARRASLMAQGCELAMQRQLAEADPNRTREVATQIDLLRTQAEHAPNCKLWMLNEAGPRSSVSQQTILRDCYRAVEQAIQLLGALQAAPLQVQSAQRGYTLTLLAEAASSLHVALVSVGARLHDSTPDAVYAWLRQESFRTRVSIARFMSDDDHAEPAEVAGLLGRIQTELAALSDATDQGNDHTQALNRISFGAKQAIRDRAGATEQDLDRLLDHVASAINHGVSPKDPKLLCAVGSLVNTLIDGMRPHEQQFLDRLSEQLHHDVPIDLDEDSRLSGDGQWTNDVVRVREKLRGRDLVLVGGLPKPHVQDRLKRAFQLRDVLWEQIVEHTSSSPIKPLIERPGTALVCMIIRWSGHQMVDDVRKWCSQAGKPVVSVTGGPNPNSVADAIVKQASDRLGLA